MNATGSLTSGNRMTRLLAGSTGLRFVGMLFGFLVGVQLARGLGPEGYGIYGLALSVISMLAIPAEFGVPPLVTREVAAAHVRQQWPAVWSVLLWAVRTVVGLAVVTLAIAGVAWLVLRDKVTAELLRTFLAGLLLILLIPLGNLTGAAIRGLQNIMKGQVPDVILRPALFSLLLFGCTFLLPFNLTPAVAMSLQVVAAGISLAVAGGMLRKLLPPLPPRAARPPGHRGWLHSALPMALADSMRAVQGNLALIALGYLAAPAAVGIFRVGMSAGLLLTMPLTVAYVVSGPMFSSMHAAGDKAALQKSLTQTTTLSVVGVIACVLPFAVAGETLLGVIFGHEFRESNSVILILSLGTLLSASLGPVGSLLNMTGQERYVTRSFAVSVVLLALLAPPLILVAGGNGAALANSIGLTAWSALMWRHARRTLGYDSSVWSAFRRKPG